MAMAKLFNKSSWVVSHRLPVFNSAPGWSQFRSLGGGNKGPGLAGNTHRPSDWAGHDGVLVNKFFYVSYNFSISIIVCFGGFNNKIKTAGKANTVDMIKTGKQRNGMTSNIFILISCFLCCVTQCLCYRNNYSFGT